MSKQSILSQSYFLKGEVRPRSFMDHPYFEFYWDKTKSLSYRSTDSSFISSLSIIKDQSLFDYLSVFEKSSEEEGVSLMRAFYSPLSNELFGLSELDAKHIKEGFTQRDWQLNTLGTQWKFKGDVDLFQFVTAQSTRIQNRSRVGEFKVTTRNFNGATIFELKTLGEKLAEIEYQSEKIVRFEILKNASHAEQLNFTWVLLDSFFKSFQVSEAGRIPVLQVCTEQENVSTVLETIREHFPTRVEREERYIFSKSLQKRPNS